MIILTMRTDRPDAEIGLYNNEEQMAYETWTAHRQLAETLHQKIKGLLASQNLNWKHIEGIVMYEGPGSFTGLRIGLSVGNALAYANHIPSAGATADNWVQDGMQQLRENKGSSKPVVPEYGAEAHITTPKK